MTRTLVISAATASDLTEAFAWYNTIRPGLGDDFVIWAKNALDRTIDYPEAFVMIQPDVRRALVRRFPYGVFFVSDSIASRLRRYSPYAAIPPAFANASRVRPLAALDSAASRQAR